MKATCLWQPSQNWLNCSVRSRSSACNEWFVVECNASISWTRATQACASLNCSSLYIIVSWATLSWKRGKKALVKSYDGDEDDDIIHLYQCFYKHLGLMPRGSPWSSLEAGLPKTPRTSSLRRVFHLGWMSHLWCIFDVYNLNEAIKCALQSLSISEGVWPVNASSF